MDEPDVGDGECPALERLEKRRVELAAGRGLSGGKAFQRGKTTFFLAPYAQNCAVVGRTGCKPRTTCKMGFGTVCPVV